MKKFVSIIAAFILAMIILLCSSISAVAEPSFSGQVTASNIGIYYSPYVNEANLDSYWTPYSYKTVYIFHHIGSTDAQRTWLLVSSNIQLFVPARYVKYSGTMNATITGSGVNLRVRPSTSNSAVIKILQVNTRVKILESISGWYRVTCPYGTGWVSSSFIQPD